MVGRCPSQTPPLPKSINVNDPTHHKALDEAQLTLLQSKEGIERLMKEVEALRAQVRLPFWV